MQNDLCKQQYITFNATISGQDRIYPKTHIFRTVLLSIYGVKSDWAPVVSGVPKGTVLGPLLFSLHTNDITADIESEIRLFADDCVCYREIKDKKDTLKLRKGY